MSKIWLSISRKIQKLSLKALMFKYPILSN